MEFGSETTGGNDVVEATPATPPRRTEVGYRQLLHVEHLLPLASGRDGPRRDPVRLRRPPNHDGALPTVLYFHGAGRVFGSKHTHDRLIRELCACLAAAYLCGEAARTCDDNLGDWVRRRALVSGTVTGALGVLLVLRAESRALLDGLFDRAPAAVGVSLGAGVLTPTCIALVLSRPSSAVRAAILGTVSCSFVLVHTAVTAADRIWAQLPGGAGRLTNLAGMIRARAAVTPDAPAIIEPRRTLSFAELDARSSRVAQALRGAGVQPGDRVAYVGVNAPSFLEVFYGVAKLGAVTTAVNNRLAPNEITTILGDAEPTVTVLGAGELSLADASAGGRVVDAAGYEAWLAPHPDEDPGVDPGPEDPALILYTSGTTGLPKGIVLTGRSLSQALAVMHYDMELDTTSVALTPVPYFHIAGLGMAMVATLNGAALLLEMTTEPSALVDLLVSRRVSHAVLVPTLIQRLVQSAAARDADWSALKYLVYGAAPIPLPIIKAATGLFGCKFVQSYGLTESTGGVTVLWPEDHLPPPEREQQLRSVGRVMPGVQLRVVDPVTLQDLPTGQRGEVLIAGGHLMREYWRRPEATAAALTPDGWLRTGDGGSFDEQGFLYLHDRLKDMIVSGGENVFPAEVESVLTGHPGVAEVAVIGVASQEWGESPYAVVVRAPGSAVTGDEVIAYARERLAHFKCPVGVAFVEALPRNASGKLLKRTLREQYGAR